jgi:serine kinase of HPr protein (carbohydrate metabolism regulator)
MRVKDIREDLQLELAAGENGLDHEVEGAYCGDLLSDVMANCEKGSAWITIQGHQNIVAVAVLREMAAIILSNGRVPDPETRAKADAENIHILLSSLRAYQLAGRLYEMGIGRTGA